MGFPAEDVEVQKIQSRLWAKQRGHPAPQGWKGCSFTGLSWAVPWFALEKKLTLKKKEIFIIFQHPTATAAHKVPVSLSPPGSQEFPAHLTSLGKSPFHR